MLRRLLSTTVISSLAVTFAFAALAKDIAVTSGQVESLGIKLSQTRQAMNETVALLPAVVVPAMNEYVAASAPFSGTVVKAHVLPGQFIKKGDPLTTLASRELLETLSQLAQSEAELQATKAIADRKRILADKNIYSPTMATEAEAQVAKIEAVIEQNRRTVTMDGIKLGENGHYTIVASSDGRVDEIPAMPGDAVQPMGPVATFHRSEQIWVQAQVSADLVGKIRPGDKIEVIDGPQGVVVSVVGSLDKLTRSATMLASLPTESGLLPGQLVTLSVVRTAVTGSLEVPASAVSWINKRHAVFVRQADGFRLATVTVRGKSSQGATVTGELSEGELVASSGLPQLEFMLGGGN